MMLRLFYFLTFAAMRIVFMGTPEFAVESLRAVCDAGYDVVGVVTMPDKPVGRGQKLTKSAVKIFAEERGLKVLQPEKLKDENFVAELRSLNADLQVVVAFRMLPEVVWSMPRLGTFNLHAALLPQYRGAAPINWAVINGEKQTGATTFMLKHELDTGDIMLRQAIDILPDDDAGSVHDKLMVMGAQMVVDTIRAIEEGSAKRLPQSEMEDGVALHGAPKIFKDDMHIDWNRPTEQVHNLVRGLSPYPAAWTDFPTQKGEMVNVKIFKTKMLGERGLEAGEIATDGKSFLKVGTADGALAIEELQMAGKKRMNVQSFLQGFHLPDGRNFCSRK